MGEVEKNSLESLFKTLPVLENKNHSVSERVDALLLTNATFLKRKRGNLPKDKKRLDVLKDINKKTLELQRLLDNSPAEWCELLEAKGAVAFGGYGHFKVKNISKELEILAAISGAVINDKNPMKQADNYIDAITGEAAKHYMELTGKKITVTHDSENSGETVGCWPDFLKKVFEILDIKSSAKSRAKEKTDFINTQLL